jgi:predicted  nucleic acid-binding Zn-ribbon protein
MALLVEISAGELIDKITILEIKLENIKDPEKLAHVRHEYETLTATRQTALPQSEALAPLTQALKQVNAALWQIEDDIRALESAQNFGPEFIALARAVYRTNDRRAALKREINALLGSDIVEEKSYAAY